jgi:RsiW-degrading membrane proteinase PrsW (M82 family)
MSINKSIPSSDLDFTVQHDWSKIYELACKELGIQQEKRDKVINLYLVLFSFLVPFVGSTLFVESSKNQDISQRMLIGGLVLLVAAIVGLMFSRIVIRYRIYKEVHWITCSTITKLPYLKPGCVTKENVQSMFLDTMKLKAKYFYDEPSKLSDRRFKEKNRSSAETFSFGVLALLSSIMLGLSLYLLLPCLKPGWIRIAVPAVVFLSSLWLLMRRYMRDLFEVYHCLALKRGTDDFNKAFNKSFEKAWFLHVYYETYSMVGRF